jgi:hypothetical protein
MIAFPQLHPYGPLPSLTPLGPPFVEQAQTQQAYNHFTPPLMMAPNDIDGSDMGLSRQSSYSSFASAFTPVPVENMYDLPSTANSGASQLLAPFLHQPISTPNNSRRPTLPPIQVNVFSTPGKMGRPRSSSRVAPYNRHDRSTSISTVASTDDLAPFSAHTQSSLPFQPTSSASPQRGLTHGLGRLSLHQQETNSNTAGRQTVKKQRSGPLFPKPNRSVSMSILRPSNSFDFAENTSIEYLRDISPEESLNQNAPHVHVLSNAQKDKARSAWVRDWLKRSFERSPGFNVSRQGLYHTYELASQEHGMTPINPASFGKAVRAAFHGIKTRRLGQRGSSKYHYVHLRPALATVAQRLNEHVDANG